MQVLDHFQFTIRTCLLVFVALFTLSCGGGGGSQDEQKIATCKLNRNRCNVGCSVSPTLLAQQICQAGCDRDFEQCSGLPSSTPPEHSTIPLMTLSAPDNGFVHKIFVGWDGPTEGVDHYEIFRDNELVRLSYLDASAFNKTIRDDHRRANTEYCYEVVANGTQVGDIKWRTSEQCVTTGSSGENSVLWLQSFPRLDTISKRPPLTNSQGYMIAASNDINSDHATVLHMLNPTNGQDSWSFPAPALISDFIADDQNVFLLSRFKLFALNAITGIEQWNLDITNHYGMVYSSTNQTLYYVYYTLVPNTLATSRAHIVALNGATKAEIWQFEIPEDSYAQRLNLLLGPNRMYIPFNQKLIAIDLNPQSSTNRVLWTIDETQLGVGNIVIGPTATADANGNVLFSSNSGLFYSFDSNGVENWHIITDSTPGKPAFAADGTVYLNDSTSLYAVDPLAASEPNRVLFKVNHQNITGSQNLFSLIAKNNMLYAKSSSDVVGLTLTGEFNSPVTLAWKIPVITQNDLAILQDTLFFVSGNYVYALDTVQAPIDYANLNN